jgi:integrase
MLRFVFRPKSSRVYRGRYRLGNGRKILDVSLDTDKRHVAETKLTQLVTEQEAELAGLLAPKPLRDAAQKTLAEHLKDYVADLSAQKCSKKHVALARNRVRRLCQQCGWVKPCDATSDGFNSWRAKQKLAPKTCNEYLGLASAFLNWMERNQRISFNPLRRVAKAETKGQERRKRRALSQTEIDTLVSKSGKRGLAYFLAAYTGLRRGEIKQLMWSDVHLDAPKPFIEVRASTTKNKKSALIPLVPALADALRIHRAARGATSGSVFKHGVPTAETLRDDLKACDIAVCDDLGRIVDFHALRHTFGSMLARAGIPPRVAMELMRHSDMRLTQNTYTDATLLPLFNEVEKLPCPSPSLGASLNSAKTGQNEGKPVQSDPARTSGKIVAISYSRAHLAKAVPSWENAELAERVGFEPTVPFPVHMISSHAS